MGSLFIPLRRPQQELFDRIAAARHIGSTFLGPVSVILA
jgi:hypothetical protein